MPGHANVFCTEASLHLYLPPRYFLFSLRNCLCVETDLTELFEQQWHNIAPVWVTAPKVLKICGVCAELIWNVEQPEVWYTWKCLTAKASPENPLSLWGPDRYLAAFPHITVLSGNFSYVLWFPSQKCGTLECHFSQVISPVSFLQWCILLDVIFKIPFFSRVCQTLPSPQSLHQRNKFCTDQQDSHVFMEVNYVMILFFHK